MTAADMDAAARRQRAQTIALWRWALIEPAMDAGLTSRQRGQIVRELAGREHAGPSGRTVSVSRKTIDRWITARRSGGFDALVPAPRAAAPRTHPPGGEPGGGVEKGKPGPRADPPARRAAAAGIRQVRGAEGEPDLDRGPDERPRCRRPGLSPGGDH